LTCGSPDFEHPKRQDPEEEFSEEGAMKPKAETKALVPQQPAAEFSHEQVELIRRTIAKGCSDDELALFLGICRRSGLDPFSRQAYCVRRWDSREKREIAQVQVSIDGCRLIASRTREYEGAEGPFWCGADGVWRDVWLEDGPPAACKMGVWRTGCRAPFWAVARFSEYLQLDREGHPAGLWRKMPAAMLAKCCEALALRRAFPAELSNIYSMDEMAQADRDPAPPPVVSIAAPEQTKPPQSAQDAPARPSPFEEMIAEFAKLKSRLGPDDTTYYQVLNEYGIQHCNQFRDLGKARSAYQKLLTRVREAEAARQSAEKSAMTDTAALLEEIKLPEEEAIP
jgi:phage recombination protein Bet